MGELDGSRLDKQASRGFFYSGAATLCMVLSLFFAVFDTSNLLIIPADTTSLEKSQAFLYASGFFLLISGNDQLKILSTILSNGLFNFTYNASARARSE